MRAPLDLIRRAENGLRRGRTTGTCATAAVKAALSLLVHHEKLREVAVTLPDERFYLPVPVRSVELTDNGARATVVKDAGDDPDNTDGAVIFAVVRANRTGAIRFFAGEGVGIVTEPGIRVAIGEPAINPAPRQMMRQAVAEVPGNGGFDLEIGCVDGATIAKKTFNPRLGIVGGISIIGTTGIVEPMSLAAYLASIEVYIRVALGDGPSDVAFTPGRMGTGYAKALHLPRKRIVQISNFIGFAVGCTEQVLTEANGRLGTLWVLGHPGKLAKTLDGAWDTHSAHSAMAMGAIARFASERGFEATLVDSMRHAKSVEAAVDALRANPSAQSLWVAVEHGIASLLQARLSRVDRVAVRLFALDGTALGGAA